MYSVPLASVLTTICPIAIISVLAVIIGFTIAVGAQYKLLPQHICSSIETATLLFLFYPKVILFSALNLYLARLINNHFVNTTWGFSLITMPTTVALSYFLFKNYLDLDPQLQVSVSYVKNSTRTNLLRVILVASYPFLLWIMIMLSLSICLSEFQSAMLGQSSPMTLGRYLSELGTISIELLDRVNLVLISFCFFMFFLLLLPTVLIGLLKYFIRLELNYDSRSRSRGLTLFLKKLLKNVFIALLILFSLSIMFIHIAIGWRLLGLAGKPYEDGSPHIDLSAIYQVMYSNVDLSLFGAFLGVLLAVSLWFCFLRNNNSLSGTLVGTLTPGILGAFAFFPSSFLGSVALSINVLSSGLGLFLWGTISSFAMSTFMLSCQIFQTKLYHYDNLLRLKGTTTGLEIFVRNNSRLILSILFIALFYNVVDSGFRAKLGNASITSYFGDRQGQWSPSQRGFALLFSGTALFLVACLRCNSKLHK